MNIFLFLKNEVNILGFIERKSLGENVADAIGDLFKALGFEILNFGYEDIFSDDIRQKMRRLYNDITVQFVRFMPDKFAYFNEGNIFLIEVKVCNTPIKYDSRVRKLRSLSGIQTLNKNNIGAVETSAIENYKRIDSIGIKILLVIYSSFHTRSLIADWMNNLSIVHQDKVIYGHGNASRTPYTNINLDDFKDINELLINEFGIEKSLVADAYSSCMNKITEVV